MFKTFVNPRVELLEPSLSDDMVEDVKDGLLILNEEEFLESIYRRYARVRLETMIECLEIIRNAGDWATAVNIMKFHACRHIDSTVSDVTKRRDMFIKINKRGNPRNNSRKTGL